MIITESRKHRFLAREARDKIIALLLLVCLLASPVAALAGKGKKNYERGLQYEAAQMWEKAAEQFALAVAAEPSNPEYQLHYRRALFNASQVLVVQGSAMAERGEYTAAYNVFRRANNYDPANQLALAQMERMVRLQMEKDGTADASNGNSADAKNAPPSLYGPNLGIGVTSRVSSNGNGPRALPSPPDQRPEQLRTIKYSGDLEDFIRHFAQQLDLNVVFDREFPRRTVNLDLRNVTAAQALDYVFISHGIFFQRLSRRTFLIATSDQGKRSQFQQQVIRTFYLSNVSPEDARSVILPALTPGVGRQPVIVPNKLTNSLTVRDTPENVRLIAEIIRGIDKDRAEVVMDVSIYEISRSDLLQLGAQLGTAETLTTLGGTSGISVVGGSRQVAQQTFSRPTALGAAIVVPPSIISALQSKERTHLVASTQVHAFAGEKSTTHIGQRVPVQTAAVTPFTSATTGGDNAQNGVNQGVFGGNGFPVIQYEKTGLTLEFTPQVFPNLDVQIKMEITANDVVDNTATLTPTFTERNIQGTARIQNNRTMMIASIAQTQQSDGRQGVPLLSQVPLFGRLFSTPRRNNQQVDIVVAVTPRVIRAPIITPRDEEMLPSGTLQSPVASTVEEILREVEREDQLAAARRLPTNAAVALPDAEPSSYIPAPKSLLGSASAPSADPRALTEATETTGPPARRPTDINLTTTNADPAQNLFLGGPTATARQEGRKDVAALPPAEVARPSEKRAPDGLPAAVRPTSGAVLRLISQQPDMRVGDRQSLKLFLKTDASLRSLAATLRFDPRVVAVRSIAQGNLLTGAHSSPLISQSVDQKGSLVVSVIPAAGAPAITGAGVLLIVEIEALAAGESLITCDAEDVNLNATDGRHILIKLLPGRITVK